MEILVTSILEVGRYPHRIFKGLFHKRWPVEEDYKAMKCWLQLENFSGKTVLSIYQDFHAKIFQKNLTSVLCFSPQSRLDDDGKKTKIPPTGQFRPSAVKYEGRDPFAISKIERCRTVDNSRSANTFLQNNGAGASRQKKSKKAQGIRQAVLFFIQSRRLS